MADQLLYPEPEWHVLECLVEERRCHVVRSRREQRVLETHSSPEPVGSSIDRRAEDRDHLHLLEPPRSGRHRRNRSIASGKPPVWPGTGRLLWNAIGGTVTADPATNSVR